MDIDHRVTPRQLSILKCIVKDFIRLGEPIGSQNLIKDYELKYSSATIRNEMSYLEKLGLLEKTHTSSGRVPTDKGYFVYLNLISRKDISKSLKQQLKALFAKRIYLIDETINEAARIISENTSLTAMSASYETAELLKSIQLTSLNENNAMIVVVTSTGRVISKLVVVNEKIKIDDLRISIRIFKERLIDTPLNNLFQKVESLTPILKESINNFEYVIQEFVTKVFDFHAKQTAQVYGRNNIINNRDIKSKNELFYLLDLLDKKSIWNTIEGNAKHDDSNLKIELGSKNAAIISKKYTGKNLSHEISIVGPKRVDYEEILSILDYLEKLIAGKTE